MSKINAARVRGNGLLVLATFIWGIAFVAQKNGGAQIGSLTFNGVRSLIGAAVIAVSTLFLDKLGISHPPANARERKTLWTGGIICGVALFAATDLQQIGLSYTTVGKGGFLTAFYILLVPFIDVFFGKKLHWINWVSVGIALVGLYLLCGRGESGFNRGDALVLGCALMFSVQIIAVDRFIPYVDAVRLSCIQFLVVGVLNLPLMFLLETPSLPAIAANWMPVLYAGLLSSGIGYTLQIFGQRDTDPTTASLLMSLESVFAALAGWVLLHDRMSAAELAGCALVFAAILLTQMPLPSHKGDGSHDL